MPKTKTKEKKKSTKRKKKKDEVTEEPKKTKKKRVRKKPTKKEKAKRARRYRERRHTQKVQEEMTRELEKGSIELEGKMEFIEKTFGVKDIKLVAYQFYQTFCTLADEEEPEEISEMDDVATKGKKKTVQLFSLIMAQLFKSKTTELLQRVEKTINLQVIDNLDDLTKLRYHRSLTKTRLKEIELILETLIKVMNLLDRRTQMKQGQLPGDPRLLGYDGNPTIVPFRKSKIIQALMEPGVSDAKLKKIEKILEC